MSSAREFMPAREAGKTAKPTRVRWRILTLLVGLAMLSYVLRMNISIAGQAIMHEFHLSPVRLGWVFSAFLFSYTACMTMGGAWTDRYGPRSTLGVAAMSWSLLTILTAVLPGRVVPSATGVIVSLLLVQVALAVSQAPMFPGAANAISHWLGRSERAFANGALVTGCLIGSAINAPLGSYLMVHLGWRGGLLAISTIGPPLALLWTWYATDHPRDHRGVNQRELEIIVADSTAAEPSPPPQGAWKVLLKDGQVWKVVIVYGLECYVEYMFLWWGFIYLVEVRKFSILRGGMASALPFILGSITTPAFGALSDWLSGRLGARRGRQIVPVVCLSAAAVLVYVGAHAADARVAVLVLSLGAAFAWGAEGPAWTTATGFARDAAGTAAGLLNTGGNFGGGLAAFLSAWIAQQVGWAGAFTVGSALAFLGSILWMTIDATHRVPAPNPTAAVTHHNSVRL